jgi:23S rRNA (adenine2503-C2)-methyltransferase
VPRHLLDLTKPDLENLFAAQGEPRYRAAQAARWTLGRGVTAFEEMSDLPAALRSRLAGELSLEPLPVVASTESDDRSTTKVLFDLGGGAAVEAVRMAQGWGEHPDDAEEPAAPPLQTARATICVSTQVGCAMGCTFCATGQQGLTRNLSCSEIVGQVLHFSRRQRVSNVVFMGMGEPLANYQATLAAVRWMTDEDGLGISARAITISTVGLRAGLHKLAREGLPLGLAISLHAPDDELRRRLIPTAGSTTIDDLLEAARDYLQQTGRRVTFAYTLIDGVNDSVRQARQLGRRLRGSRAHVNLIPCNPIASQNFRRPSRGRVRAFQRELQAEGVNATVRVERGADIAAACGQLRTETILSGVDTALGGRPPPKVEPARSGRYRDVSRPGSDATSSR